MQGGFDAKRGLINFPVGNGPIRSIASMGGNATGPLAGKNSSVFVDFDRRDIDDNAVLSVVILDSTLRITSLREVAAVPRREQVLVLVSTGKSTPITHSLDRQGRVYSAA